MYMSLNLMEEVWTGKINLSIIKIWLIFEDMGLFEMTGRKNVAGERIYKRFLEMGCLGGLVR